MLSDQILGPGRGKKDGGGEISKALTHGLWVVFGLMSPKLCHPGPAPGIAVCRSHAIVSLIHNQKLGFMLGKKHLRTPTNASTTLAAVSRWLLTRMVVLPGIHPESTAPFLPISLLCALVAPSECCFVQCQCRPPRWSLQ